MACITDTVTDLLERNKAFAAKHEPIPTFAELAEMKVPFPHIIVCMLKSLPYRHDLKRC